jgi:hypothetical protein
MHAKARDRKIFENYARGREVISVTCSRPNAHAVPLATFSRLRSED